MILKCSLVLKRCRGHRGQTVRQNYTAANPSTGQADRVDTGCKSGLKDWMESEAFLFFVSVGGFSIIEERIKTGQEQSDRMM